MAVSKSSPNGSPIGYICRDPVTAPRQPAQHPVHEAGAFGLPPFRGCRRRSRVDDIEIHQSTGWLVNVAARLSPTATISGGDPSTPQPSPDKERATMRATVSAAASTSATATFSSAPLTPVATRSSAPAPYMTVGMP